VRVNELLLTCAVDVCFELRRGLSWTEFLKLFLLDQEPVLLELGDSARVLIASFEEGLEGGSEGKESLARFRLYEDGAVDATEER